MSEFDFDNFDEIPEKSAVNVYYCKFYSQIVYNITTPALVKSYVKCEICGFWIYIPPKVELREDWYVWYHYFKYFQLYHITDYENVESIETLGGLYSWAYLEKNNIKISRPGGNRLSRDLDLRKNLQDYVRLSFNKNSPMFYNAQKEGRIHNPVIYSVNPIVILFKGNKFSNINANDKNAIIGEDMSDFFRIDYSIASEGEFQNEEEKKLIQAEILVKTHIPISFLEKVDDSNDDNEDDDDGEDLPF